MTDMLARTPTDLETPKFSVLNPSLNTPGFELRQYDSYAMAEVVAA